MGYTPEQIKTFMENWKEDGMVASDIFKTAKRLGASVNALTLEVFDTKAFTIPSVTLPCRSDLPGVGTGTGTASSEYSMQPLVKVKRLTLLK